MRHFLALLLLLPAVSHAMQRYDNAAMRAFNSLMLHSLPSQMNIVAEMKIPQKNGTRSVARFLYFKGQSDTLVPTTGGLLAGHQDSESYNLEIELQEVDRDTGYAEFECKVKKVEGPSAVGTIKIPLNASSAKTYPLSMHDEFGQPIQVTIQSTIKK